VVEEEMMKPRNTLILLAILVVLGAYVYFFEMRTPEAGTSVGGGEADNLAVFDLVENDIVGLSVADAHGAITSLSREPNQPWQLTAPTQEPADDFRVTTMVSRLARLRASRVLTDVTDLANYGLTTPVLTATLAISGGAKVSLVAGDQTPDKSGYYALHVGTPNVYILFSNVVDDLKGFVSEPPVQPTPTPTGAASPTPGLTILPTFTPTVTPTVTITATPGLITLPTPTPTLTPEGPAATPTIPPMPTSAPTP
jgi:hypothetical protein